MFKEYNKQDEKEQRALLINNVMVINFGVLEGACSIQAESMVQQGFDSLRIFNRI